MILCVRTRDVTSQDDIPEALRSLKPHRAQCSTQPPDGAQVQTKGAELWVMGQARLCVQSPHLTSPKGVGVGGSMCVGGRVAGRHRLTADAAPVCTRGG